jgi:predicted nuclease of predicted toxin-antitoxin system
MPHGVRKNARSRSPAHEIDRRYESIARWIDLLNEAGLNAVHWSDVGRPSAPDSEIMSYARTTDCVVLTHDLDFGAILAATQGAKPSVVQLRAEDVSPDVIGAQVISALRQMEAELTEGALLTFDPSRTRLRLLPLRNKR